MRPMGPERGVCPAGPYNKAAARVGGLIDSMRALP